MHPGNPGKLRFEMQNRPTVWIVGVEVTKGASQQPEQLRLMMIALGANLDQLHEVGRRLGAQVILANSSERIFENDFSERVQGRFSTRNNRDFSFKKKIELAGERRFGPARTLGHGVNAAERLGAPTNDQAGVAKLAFAQENGGSCSHIGT